MAEVGLIEEEPTLIYQDCAPAVQMAVNRGSLGKRTKANDIRVLSICNRIEDSEVQMKLISTVKMIADVGTKALPQKECAFRRDELNGFALERANHWAMMEMPSLEVGMEELISPPDRDTSNKFKMHRECNESRCGCSTSAPC